MIYDSGCKNSEEIITQNFTVFLFFPFPFSGLPVPVPYCPLICLCLNVILQNTHKFEFANILPFQMHLNKIKIKKKNTVILIRVMCYWIDLTFTWVLYCAQHTKLSK